MGKYFLITILSFFITMAVCNGQKKEIVPVSPEAAAFTKMANNPVNFYTGIPDISIPLHEIKVGELSLPVTLQYHAGGFKVNEKSTRVGMGWNLGCDLQVTREINGLDDFQQNGYMKNAKMTSSPYPFDITTGQLYWGQNIHDVANGDADGQPDKFYYKLLGKSGTFFILKDAWGPGYSFVPVPYDNIRIEFLGKNFIITDSDGTKYHFGDGNSGREVTWQGTSGVTTAWKCMKITSNIGRVEFSFTYEGTTDKNYTRRDFIEYYSAYHYAQSCYLRSDQYPLYGSTSFNGYTNPLSCVSNPKYIECIANRSTPKLHVPYYDHESGSFIDYEMDYNVYGYPVTSSALYVDGLTLKEITFRGGKVVFSGANKLSQVDVKDVSGQTLKTFRFYQDYKAPINAAEAKKYNGDNFQGTLYLDSLTLGSPSQPYETYKFLYHSKYCFGNHLTGHDAWKYPNLSTKEIGSWDKSGILPALTSHETYYFSTLSSDDKVEGVPLTTPGSEWSLASHEESMKNGVLKRIVYPTGGFVDFDFEANQYPVQFLVDYAVYVPAYTSIFPQYCGGLRIRSINFYEPGATGTTSQKYYKYGKHENGMGDLVYAPKIDTSDGSYNLAPVVTSQFVANVKWPCDYYGSTCQYRNQLTLLSIERKKMIYPASSLDYSYGNGIFVFYTDVAEYNMELGAQSGKTVYSYYPPKGFYTNYWEYQSHIAGTTIPYIKTGVYNGAQKSVSRYRSTPEGKYELVHKTSFEYRKHERQPKIQVAYAEFNILYNLQGGNGPAGANVLYNYYYPSPAAYLMTDVDNSFDFVYGTYTIPVGKLLVEKRTEELYDSLGNATTTETFFGYDTRCQLVSSRSTNSKGEEVLKSYKYPYNLSGVYADMSNRNMTGMVIEEQEHVDGRKTKTTRNNYKVITGSGYDFIAPSSIEIAYMDGPLDEEVSFDEYDQYGNILQLTEKSQYPVSYLWGYWGLYPVAELKGARYADIPATFKSNASINVPQKDASLRAILVSLKNNMAGNPLVTGYTYKWLTGVTSRTDAGGSVTYYEYDPYGRLSSVKDDAGKTLQSHAYNMPRYTHPPYTWSVNTPQLISVTGECLSGAKQSYSVILPGGGGYKTVSTEQANRAAREDYHAGNISGIGSPPACSGQTVKIKLYGTYNTFYNPFFTISASVDFLQNGSVVYTFEMPFYNMDDVDNNPFVFVDLYVIPGTYEVSMRLHPGMRYTNGNIPIYGCTSYPGDYINFNSTSATVTFNPSSTYHIGIGGDVFGWTVTPIVDFR